MNVVTTWLYEHACSTFMSRQAVAAARALPTSFLQPTIASPAAGQITALGHGGQHRRSELSVCGRPKHCLRPLQLSLAGPGCMPWAGFWEQGAGSRSRRNQPVKA